MSDSPSPRPFDDLGRLIEILARQAEAANRLVELIETRSLPLLERIAAALERAPAVGSAARPEVRGIAEFRQAIAEGQWDHAEAIARELAADQPEDPKVASLLAELARARDFAAADLRQRIEAARSANDPDGAMAARDDLAKILRGEAILEVDRPLVKWLMTIIQRRLRTGTIGADVVALSGRVAESFGGTTEGASLRASLPTLRRCAGLCPSCAEPYAGVGDACPKCLAAAPGPAPGSLVDVEGAADPEAEPEPRPDLEPELEPDDESIREPLDLNNERFWQDP